MWTLLEDCEVALGVRPVPPLLVEHDRQALLHGEGAGRGPTVAVRRRGLGGERLLGKPLEHAAYVGLPGAAELEDLVQGRPGRAVAEFPVVIAGERRIESPEVSALAITIGEQLSEQVRRHATR